MTGSDRQPTGPGQAGEAAALTDLADAFDHHDFITVLTTGQHRRPRLTVTARHTAIAEDIYAHGGWYWLGCAERLAPVTGPAAAAAAIACLLCLRTRPPPAGTARETRPRPRPAR